MLAGERRLQDVQGAEARPLIDLGSLWHMTELVTPRPSRLFSSDDVLNGQAKLDDYPLRYICLVPPMGGRMRTAVSFGIKAMDEVDKILSAVELLETQGWEVVTLDQAGLTAFMRRTLPR